MKQGDIVAMRLGFGNIELLRYHSNHWRDPNKIFNAYLNFDMSSEHTTLYEFDRIIDMKEIIELLEKETK